MALPGYYQANHHSSDESIPDNLDFEISDSLLDNLSLKEQSQRYKLDAFSAESSKKQAQSDKDKLFVCFLETCRKRFSQHCSLQKHERIHRGEKPFVCQTCGHAFTQNSNLKRHERLHTGEKPHECEFCPKTFANISNLKQHLQIHQENTNRYKYLCHVCSRTYYYQSSLKKHMREHSRQIEIDENPSSTSITKVEYKTESFSKSQRKKVKLEVEKEGGCKQRLEISLEVDQSDICKLPTSFQKILADSDLLVRMQSIALKNGMKGSNAVESFERIRYELRSFFEPLNPSSVNMMASQGAEDSFFDNNQLILNDSLENFDSLLDSNSSSFSELLGSEVSLEDYEIEISEKKPQIKICPDAKYPTDSFYGVEGIF